MKNQPEVLEFIGKQFRQMAWGDFVRLTVREITGRSFVLKAHDFYFVGGNDEADRVVARKYPGRVRHIFEWLEVVLPYWSTDILDKPLMAIPLRSVENGGASDVLARIKELANRQMEVMA